MGTASHAESGQLTVLVVDDNPGIVFSVKVAFEMEGFAVLTAGDGAEALSQLNKGPRPDAVILDVMMPRVDGWRVLEAMRGSEEWAEIPVVMLTALTDEERQARGLETGADWYQRKPFAPQDLVPVVRRLIGDES